MILVLFRIQHKHLCFCPLYNYNIYILSLIHCFSLFINLITNGFIIIKYSNKKENMLYYISFYKANSAYT